VLDLGFRDLTQVQKDEDLQSLHAEKRFRELALIADVDKMSREEGWRFDLKVLARELQRLHHAPLTHAPRQPRPGDGSHTRLPSRALIAFRRTA
jgi:hypothetical protein